MEDYKEGSQAAEADSQRIDGLRYGCRAPLPTVAQALTVWV